MSPKNPRTRPTLSRHSIVAMAAQAALCGGTLLTAAQAQTPEPATESSLPLVKVRAGRDDETASGAVGGLAARRSATATKTDTLLSETPRSISVITREQIEAQNPLTMHEALGYTPGVFAPPLATSSVDSTSSFSVRGFRASDGEVFFQDGTRAKFSGWWSYNGYEPYAFERIEVLRGPASILYGQGQPNGTINMVSKRPTTSALRELGAEVGSFSQKKLTADVSGALDDAGIWSYRVTALARDGGTQIEHAQDNRLFLAAALAWRPSAKTELILRASVQRNEGESNNNLPAEGTLLANPNGKIPRHRAINANNDAHYDSKNLGWEFEHRLDDVWTMRSVMRMNQTTGRREAATFIGLGDDKRTAQRSVTNYWSLGGNYNVTLDNNVQARFSTGSVEHLVLAGLDYARQKDGWQLGDGTAAPLDLFNPVYTPVTYLRTPVWERTANDQQLGLYVQDQLKIDKRWIVSIGGRKDWAKNWTLSGDPGAAVSDGPTQKDDALTWQTGAAYVFDGGLTPYLSYAESYVPTLGTNLTGQFLKPETGRQYEAGLKYQPVNGRLSVTAAVFDILRQNVLGPDPANPNNRLQRGEVASRGFEFEARGELSRELSLIGSYAYTKTEVTKSDQADRGKELMQSPRHAGSLWLDYAPSDVAGLSIGAGVRYVGATWGDDVNTLRVPGYTLVDLALRYDLGKLNGSLKGTQAYLNVKNLTDKTYLTCFYGNCLYGIERSVAAGLRYQW